MREREEGGEVLREKRVRLKRNAAHRLYGPCVHDVSTCVINAKERRTKGAREKKKVVKSDCM